MNTDLLANVEVAIATEVQELLTLLQNHFAKVNFTMKKYLIHGDRITTESEFLRLYIRIYRCCIR